MKNPEQSTLCDSTEKQDDPGSAFNRLCDIMAQLRSENGCPWDAEQTPESLRPYIIEEAYEVLEAIDSKNHKKICEELGDLLLQVVFQAQIFSESGSFTAAEVANSISDKLVRRHPHVFAETIISDQAELHRQWDSIKQREQADKGESTSILNGIPHSLPALMRAQKISSRANRHGLSLSESTDSRALLAEQLTKLGPTTSSKSKADIHRLLGDILFTLVNLARELGGDAEMALHDAANRHQATLEENENCGN